MKLLSEMGIFRKFWIWYDGVSTPPGGSDDPYVVASVTRWRKRTWRDILDYLQGRLCRRAIAYFAFRAGMLAARKMDGNDLPIGDSSESRPKRRVK